MNETTREQQIHEHLEAIRRLQAVGVVGERGPGAWPPAGYYLVWHVLLGMGLGAGAALVSRRPVPPCSSATVR